MMNGPYYRNHSRSVPVQQPKVVSIPVHFVSSDHQPQTNISTLKHSSALKIQKVFKGHTVRKSVQKIVSIKNEVNEIEKRLKNDVEFVDLLRNDAKERLRVNETLMSLLFKLDSVRGVENGVRDLRKSVAKKAVALQEKVDSIAQSSEEDHDDVINDEKTELCDGDDVSNSIGNKVNGEDVKEVVVGDDVSNKNRDQELVANEAMNEDSVKDCDDDVSSNARNRESVVTEQDVKEAVEKKCDDDDVSKSCCDHETGINEDCVTDEGTMKECGGGDDVTKNDQNPESVEDGVIDDVSNENRDQEELVMNDDSMAECDDDVSSNVRNQESVETEQDVKEGVEKKCDDDDVTKSCCDKGMVVNEGKIEECGGDDDVSRRCCDKGMVEKLMCDNAKMMKLMIQISERNEMQTRMINSLSRRVEQLEKAFMSDKSRRRKKSSTRREKDAFSI